MTLEIYLDYIYWLGSYVYANVHQAINEAFRDENPDGNQDEAEAEEDSKIEMTKLFIGYWLTSGSGNLS